MAISSSASAPGGMSRSKRPRALAAHVRELLPQPEYWPVMPPEQTPERVRDRIVEFGRAHR